MSDKFNYSCFNNPRKDTVKRCQTKVAFRNPMALVKATRTLRKKYPQLEQIKIYMYLCYNCGCFHSTLKPRKKNSEIK